ncbi:T9SS type A sorting domain-containing protein [bacterium]|nr:T9SS type A sorting domain-containing protein [bacterium]
MKKFTLLLCLFFAFSFRSIAGHSFGAEVHYEAIDSFKYVVYFEYYRDCRSLKLNNPSNACSTVCVTTGTAKVMSLTLLSIEEVTPTNSNFGCQPSNTFSTGEGLEKHTYVDTVDFNSSYYSSLKSCCDIRFECSTGGRNNQGYFTGTGYYNYAYLNLCEAAGNSSPTFHNPPLNIYCCSQPVFINMGTRDTFNDDSLSYHFVQPLVSRTSSASYTGGFSYENPLTVYYYGNLQFPYNNPLVDPPVGIYLSPKSGDLIFTPVKCDDVSTYAIEVKEWKKDTAGNVVQIGSIRRDMLVYVKPCPSNNVPKMNIKTSYTVCLGETLCLDIETEDDVFVPPPPASAPDPDTTSLFWNHAIPDASFEITNDTGRLATAQFCWTPTEADVRTRPYYVVFEARDNAVPFYAQNQRAIEIKVAYPAEAEFSKDSLGCGEYALSAQIDADFKGTPEYRWRVLDTTGLHLSEDYAYFSSDSSKTSRKANDTLRFKQNGIYILEGRVNNPPNNCPVLFYDTINIQGVFHTILNHNDTALCMEDELGLEARSFNGSPSYTWYVDGNNIGNTDSSFNFLGAEFGRHDIVVESENSLGCKDFDQLSINVIGINRDTLPDLITSCGKNVIINADSNLTKVYWTSTDSGYSYEVSQSGIYLYTAYDALGCEYTDYTNVTIFNLPTLTLNDSTACEDAIQLNVGNFDSYSFSNGSSANPVLVSNSGLLKVIVEDANGCIQKDSALITLHGKPSLNLREDTGLCCKSSSINLLTWLDALDPNAGLWTNPANPNSIQSGVFLYPNRLCGVSNSTQKLFYTYTHPNTGCLFRDSINVEIYPQPVTSLNSGAYCQEEALIDLETELVHTPSSITTELQWSCLDCSGFDFQNLLIDQSTGSIPEYWLKVDETSYTVQSLSIDTLTLQLIYTSEDGCSTKDTTEIMIGAKPEIPILSKQDEYIRVTNATGTVRWYRDGTWLSVVSDTIIDASFPGTYTARNESAIGCLSDESDEIVRTIGIVNITENSFRITPNPSNGLISISPNDGMLEDISQINIRNSLGQDIKYTSNIAGQNINLIINETAGIYFIEIQTTSGIFRATLIIE